MLGLSQLHQLRGRVGRGRERAYAYFLYPPEKPLTETAHDRLATIAQHSDLGGGMAVAMKDLEIRGAGNLLGGEQSGHIADVGFDLYVRLVGEAVAEFRGTAAASSRSREVKIELPIDAHLPHDYVPSERLRLEMYKRLAEVRSDEDVRAAPRGAGRPLRHPARRRSRDLLAVASFRARARPAGTDRGHRPGQVHPVRTRSSCPTPRVVRLNRLHPESLVQGRPCVRCWCRDLNRPASAAQPLRDEELLDWARQVIDDVIEPGSEPGAGVASEARQ